MTESELLQLFGDTFDSNHLPIPNPSATPITTGRDLAMDANSSDFWAVRIVMASAYGTDDGSYFPDTNHILIRYATINIAVQNWNNSAPAQQVSLDGFIRRVTLHELGHALTTEAHSSSGIMQVYQSLFEDIQQNKFISSNLLDIQRLSRVGS